MVSDCCQVGAGILVLLYGLTGGAIVATGGAVIGAVLIVGGLLSVAAAQITRATVDNADQTREILYLLHRRLR